MANLSHNGGLPNLVSEIGFSLVKYFETTLTVSPQTLTIDPPAKRLILRNTDDNENVFIRVDGQVVSATIGAVPGDNIKIGPGGIFTMDFDSLHSLSMVSSGSAVVEGILGFKGIS